MDLDTSADELTNLLSNYLGEPMRFRFDDGFQVEEKSLRALIEAIDKLHEGYLDNYYPSQYKADCYVLLKEYTNAFKSCITPPIGKK